MAESEKELKSLLLKVRARHHRSKVKWALGSITTNKVSEGYRIPVELFQTLKDDAVKVLHSICQQIRKSAVATRLEMINFIKSQRKAMPKNILTASQLHSSHRLAK